MPSATLYHSEICRLGEVDVTITCDKPIPSKFRGKPDRVSMKLDGDERYYEVENDECGDALVGLQGKTVTILATGRGSDARIEVLGESRSTDRGRDDRRDDRKDDRRDSRRDDRRDDPPPRREERHEPDRRRDDDPPPRREREPSPPTKEEREAMQRKTFKKAAVYGAKCAVVYEMAWKYAVKFAEDLSKDTFTTEDIRAIATTLYIEIKGHTDIDAMPTAFIDLKKEPEPKREPKRDPDPPPREPEPDPDAPEDDIPF